jgi:hypothetical protein
MARLARTQDAIILIVITSSFGNIMFTFGNNVIFSGIDPSPSWTTNPEHLITFEIGAVLVASVSSPSFLSLAVDLILSISVLKTKLNFN